MTDPAFVPQTPPPTDTARLANPQTLAAVHAALRPHYQAIRANDQQAREHYSPKGVHQLRVAARRLRAGFRLYRRDLATTPARQLSERLRELLAALGPARDADVWMGRLRDRAVVGILSVHPEWPQVVAQEQKRRHRARAQAEAYLASPPWQELLAQLELFFEHELPSTSAVPQLLLSPRTAKKLRRQLRAVVAEKKPLRQRSADRIHDFRRECRKARYWAEYLVPVLGPTGEKLRKDLVAIADALGSMRDADLAARKLARRRCWWSERLRDRAEQQAAKAKRDFAQKWKRFRRELDEKSLRPAAPA